MSEWIYHTVMVVEKEGLLVIEDFALKKGQRIEVAVYDTQTNELDTEDPLLLRGESFYDKDPFEPVALEEWEALQ